MLVIGSKALEAFNIPIPRKPGDLDVICTLDEYNQEVRTLKNVGALAFAKPLSGKKFHIRTKEGWNVEAEIAWEGSTGAKLIEIVLENGLHLPYEEQDGCYFASPEVVLTLKMSHRYLKNNPHFLKTMNDIRLLRGLGYSVPECLKDWLVEREKETYDYSHPSLMKRKQDFFDASVNYVWQHDDLHTALKFFELPAYTYFSGGEVWSDMSKFFELPEEVRLHAVLEEALVLACERSQLAFPDKNIDRKKSFDVALEKVCTSITSGKFREYAYENYYKVQELYEQKGKDYVERAKEAIEHGRVRPF